MTIYLIEMNADPLHALQKAILDGALAGPHAQITAAINSNRDHSSICDSYIREADALYEAARLVCNAKVKPKEAPEWDVMTDEDFNNACHYMQEEARAAFAMNPGGYVTAYNETITAAAAAYFRADRTNQQVVKAMFGHIYRVYHEKRKLLEGAKA